MGGCGWVFTHARLGPRADAGVCEPGAAARRTGRSAQRHLLAGRGAAYCSPGSGRAGSRPGRRTIAEPCAVGRAARRGDESVGPGTGRPIRRCRQLRRGPAAFRRHGYGTREARRFLDSTIGCSPGLPRWPWLSGGVALLRPRTAPAACRPLRYCLSPTSRATPDRKSSPMGWPRRWRTGLRQSRI